MHRKKNVSLIYAQKENVSLINQNENVSIINAQKKTFH